MALRSVFLTGATGHSGEAVLRELVRSGFEVTALVRKPTLLGGCRTAVAELSNVKSVAQEISRAEAIVHLASPGEFDEKSALRDDVLGTSYLLEAWRGTGPFLFASSPSVQQWSPLPIGENSPIDVRNWYEVQKFTNELQVRLAAASRPGSAGIVLRPGFFFGPSSRRDGRQFLSAVYQHCQLGGNFVCRDPSVASADTRGSVAETADVWRGGGVQPDLDRGRRSRMVATRSGRLRIQFTHTDPHQQLAACGCSASGQSRRGKASYSW
jgi:nucleoside-diphosphate-sugar epimerase